MTEDKDGKEKEELADLVEVTKRQERVIEALRVENERLHKDFAAANIYIDALRRNRG